MNTAKRFNESTHTIHSSRQDPEFKLSSSFTNSHVLLIHHQIDETEARSTFRSVDPLTLCALGSSNGIIKSSGTLRGGLNAPVQNARFLKTARVRSEPLIFHMKLPTHRQCDNPKFRPALFSTMVLAVVLAALGNFVLDFTANWRRNILSKNRVAGPGRAKMFL